VSSMACRERASSSVRSRRRRRLLSNHGR
jgi:hypothetical protein